MSLRKNYNHRIVKIILPLRMGGDADDQGAALGRKESPAAGCAEELLQSGFFGCRANPDSLSRPPSTGCTLPYPVEGSCARDPRAA